MKQTLKFSFFAILLANLFLITSCEENLEVSCDSFSVSVSYEVIDTSYVTLTANPIGGVPDISYLWSTGESTQSIDVTEAATYSVTATDSDDCTASIDFVVDTTGTNTPCDSLYLSFSLNDTGAGTSIEVLVQGGTQPYTYLWSNGETGSTILATEPGTYFVTVTDADGCEAYGSYSIATTNPCDSISGNIILVVDPMTFDTTITAEMIGGTAPYEYLWNTGSILNYTDVNGQGIYSVDITDDEGCMITLVYNYNYNQPCALYDVIISVHPDSMTMDVTLSADTYGGTAPYSFNWSNGEATQVINVGQATGSFSVTVEDADGCVDEDTVQL